MFSRCPLRSALSRRDRSKKTAIRLRGDPLNTSLLIIKTEKFKQQIMVFFPFYLGCFFSITRVKTSRFTITRARKLDDTRDQNDRVSLGWKINMAEDLWKRASVRTYCMKNINFSSRNNRAANCLRADAFDDSRWNLAGKTDWHKAYQVAN